MSEIDGKDYDVIMSLFEHSPDAILILDTDGCVRAANQAAEKLLGRSGAELGGEQFGLPSISGEYFETDIRTKDGDFRQVEMRTSQIELKGCDLHLAHLRDITKLKQAEDAIRQERDRAGQYLDLVGVMIVALDTGGIVRLINRKGCDLLGLPEHDILGKKWIDEFVPENQRAEVREIFSELISGMLSDYEYLEKNVVTADGVERIIAWHNSLLRNEQGEITGTLSSGLDITERKEADQKLAESEQRYRRLTNNAPDMIYRMSLPDGQYEFVNSAAEKIFGCTPAEFIDNPKLISKTMHPNWREYFKEQWEKLLAGDVPPTYEYQIVTKQGEMRWINQRNVLIQDDDGRPVALESIVTDITKRKEIERSLREKSNLLSEAEFIANLGSWRWDLSTDNLTLSEGWQRIHGCDEGSLSRDDLKQIAHPDDLPLIEEAWRRTMETGESYNIEHRIIRQDDGEVRHVRALGEVAEETDGNRHVFGVALDITEEKKAEVELEHNRQLLNETGRMARIGGWEFYPETGKQVWTEEVYRIHEVDPETYQPTVEKGLTFFPPEAHDEIAGAVNQAIESGEPFDLELPFITARDNRLWVHAVGRADRENGKTTRVYGTIQDITQLKKAEQDLAQSETLFRLLVENMNEGLVKVDTSGTVEYVNKKTCELVDISHEEIIGRKADEFIFPEDIEIYRQRLVELSENSLENYEIRLQSKTGRILHVIISPTAILDSEGRVTGGLAVLTDISKRKKVEQSLRQSEAKLRGIFDTMPSGIILVDESGKIIHANNRMAEMWGCNLEEIMGSQYLEHIHASNSSEAQERMFKLIRDEIDHVDIERLYERKDGSTFWGHLAGRRLLHPDGTFWALVGVITDITEKKKNRQELLQSRELFRDLFDNAPVGYHELDAEGRINRINKTEARILGYNPLEMLGRKIFDFIHPDHREKAVAAYRARILGEIEIEPFEREYITSEGEKLVARHQERPIRDREGRIIGMRTSVIDITKQKQAEEDLTATSLKLKTAVEAARMGFFEWDLNTNEVHYSAEWKRQIGYDEHEISDDLEEWESRVHPDDLKRVLDRIQNYIDSDKDSGYQAEFRFRHRDGHYLWIMTQGEFIRDETGRVVKMIGTHVDITELRKAEEQRLKAKEQLQQAQKMESVGQLAGGVAHDFNNILASILGYSSMLKRKKDLSDKTLRRLGEIEKAAQRGAEITKQLLSFSRSGGEKTKVISVGATIDQGLKMLRRTLGSNIEIDTRFTNKKDLIEASPTELHQVIMNLCINAKDAMPDGGALFISTEVVEDSADNPGCDLRGLGGKYVKITVRDTGEGMDKDTLDRVFEPFYTTKEVGQGTGLGLYVVYGIVEKYDGRITVDSEPGEGTEFRICFSLTERVEEEEEQEEKEIRGGTETVMVVDDNESVVNMALSILEEVGYTCLGYVDPEEALREYEQRSDEIDLVVLDMVMPKMSGAEVFKKMKGIRPNLLAVISSGYSLKNEDELKEIGIAGIVPKPYEIDELTGRVREILDAGKKERGNDKE